VTDLIEKYDGRRILLGEIAHEVRGRVIGRQVMQLCSPEGVIHEISLDEFRMHVSLGHVDGSEFSATSHQLSGDGSQLETSFRREVLELTEKFEREGLKWDVRYSRMKAHFQAHPKYASRAENFPGVRAIQKWRKAFILEGQRSLSDQRYLSGNRTPRHDPLFEELVFDILEEQYQKSDRKTAKAVWRDARVLYLDRCNKAEVTPGPHGYKVVQSLIASLPNDDVVKARLGGHEGKMRVLQAGRFARVKAPYERIEMDSTEADIFVVVDDEGTAARPWVCAAIDCASGLIVGLQVSLNAPTSVLTVHTIKELLTPQSHDFFDRHDIENRLQFFGRPHDIITDQGSENAGDVIESAVQAASFELAPNLPGKPNAKPFIERFFKTFISFLIELPGATTSAEMPDRKRIPKGMKEARLTFEEFESLVQKWRYDVLAVKPQRRIHSAVRTVESPMKCFERLTQDYFVPDPPTPDEINKLFFGGRASRTLHRYGIEFNRIQYSSTTLRHLCKEIGAGQELDIRFDPTDIRTIAAMNPLSKEWLFIGAKEAEIPRISFIELKRLREQLAPDESEFLSAERILGALSKKYHHAEPKAGSKRKKSIQKATRRRRDVEIVEGSKSPKFVSNDELIEKSESLASAPRARLRKPAKISSIEHRSKS
jgi:hypothetical protein